MMSRVIKERPILFSGPMVRAILEGRKTQTRRVIKPLINEDPNEVAWYTPFDVDQDGSQRPGKMVFGCYGDEWERKCPYGAPSHRLWVRETWCEFTGPVPGEDAEEFKRLRKGIVYKADLTGDQIRDFACVWKPSIHMPRWASRLTLEIVDIGVERLTDISEEDAIAEGASLAENPDFDEEDPCDDEEHTFRAGYMKLWESINGEGSWDANPWVWVVEFKRA